MAAQSLAAKEATTSRERLEQLKKRSKSANHQEEAISETVVKKAKDNGARKHSRRLFDEDDEQ